MAGMRIETGQICTFPYSSLYPIEKVGDSPYPYPYLVIARIFHQNGNEFEQYPRRQIFLSFLVSSALASNLLRFYFPLFGTKQ